MINKVTLIGNVGAAPEVRFTQGGLAVATFTIATTEKWKKNGETQEHTEWHRIVAWQRLGEVCAEYLSKGSKVYIEGKLQTRKWKDKDGHDRYTTEIIAREMKMLSPRPSSEPSRSIPPAPAMGGFVDNNDFMGGEPPAMGDDVPF